METLVVASRQHRDQCYYSRKIPQISVGFRSPPSEGGFNCRAFESGAGILPSPPPKPTSANGCRELRSPFSRSEPPKQRKRSSPIRINAKPARKASNFSDDLSNSELWAGPAYSNSPPPSSLPIPKFSLRQKRSISLELPPVPADVTVLHPIAKSAPASPTRDSNVPGSNFFHDTASATENLRRILHLDIADD